MVQVVKQTKEEKIAMYMKCNKRALAEMLVNCNIVIESIKPMVVTKEYLKSVVTATNNKKQRFG